MGNTFAISGGAQTTHEDAERKKLKLEILRRRVNNEFPVTLREAIDETKEEDPESFLSIIEERLIDLLYGNEGKGLDCDRDTEEEIETAIRLFPQVLRQYTCTHNSRSSRPYPPIYAQLAYLKSASFIPLLAKLGIELNQFQKEERGGLIYSHWNVLRSLVNIDRNEWYDTDDEHQQSLIDEKFVAVMKGLRRQNILKQEDILEQGLLRELCEHHYIFPEQTFRYLVDWDPNCFKEYTTEIRPIYNTWHDFSRPKDIHIFRTMFEIGMLHFPMEMAFLFHIDSSSSRISRVLNGGEYDTPFRVACVDYGTEKVAMVVQDVLALVNRQNQFYDIDDDDDDDDDTAAKALIYAATNSAVHLDGVYFLLRREPGRYCRLASGGRQ